MTEIAFKGFNKKDNLFRKLPILLYAGTVCDEPHFFYPSNSHNEFCEIIYIMQGYGRFVIEGKNYIVQKGDIIVYNKGMCHEETSYETDPLKTYYCAVGNVCLEGMEEGYILPSGIEPVIHADKYTYRVERYISEIFEECYSQVVGYENVCQSLLMSLIVLIIRIIKMQNDYNALSVGATSLGMKIKKYIDRNYTRNVSLNEIANTLYLSQHYISHIFKNEIGDSPINYLIKLRIDEAKRLLLNTNMTINEISMLVGYDNANYFNNLFKKITGMTPGKFRESNLSIKTDDPK